MKRATAEDAPRQADPWPTALRLLTRRDYSTAGLRRRLNEKGFPDDAVEAVVARCLELGYLDDARFARNRARSLLAQGRAVGRRILRDLRQQGIGDALAERALAEAMADFDETALLTELLARRFPDFDYAAATPSERRRVIHYLQRRGYPLDQILTTMTRKGL